MEPKQVVALIRAIELGVRTVADEFEKLITPVNPFDETFDTPHPAPTVDSNALMFYTRPQLIALLKTVDPGFDTHLVTTKAMRDRIADLVKEHFEASSNIVAGGVSDGFAPPGVVSDPEFVEAGQALQTWFEEHMPVREETIRTYQARMGCCLRCVRPGGACPNALLCKENLSA